MSPVVVTQHVVKHSHSCCRAYRVPATALPFFLLMTDPMCDLRLSG